MSRAATASNVAPKDSGLGRRGKAPREQRGERSGLRSLFGMTRARLQLVIFYATALRRL